MGACVGKTRLGLDVLCCFGMGRRARSWGSEVVGALIGACSKKIVEATKCV